MGKTEVWDKAVRGLVKRQYADGSQTYLVKYRFRGQQFLRTLGSCDLLTMDEARTAVLEVKRLLRVESNPESFIEELLKPGKDSIWFAAFADIYLERYAKPHKKTWKEDERRLKRYLIPAFGTKRLIEITRADVAQLHSAIGSRAPYYANRLKEQIGHMITLASEWGMVPEGHRNPAHGISRFVEYSRERFVSPAEMHSLLEAIEKVRSKYARYAILLLVYSGLRKNEILKLKWCEVDLVGLEIRLPALRTKTKRAHCQPLSSIAANLLLDLYESRGTGLYVFPDKSGTGHMTRLDKAWSRVKKRAGIADIRIHDLRRTCGTWLAQSGQPLHLIKEVLNHSDIKSTLVYSRFQNSDKRVALEAFGQLVEKYKLG